ncbi:single-stranded DNA-binding protein [Streptomyces thermoviolaceus]|jgi:single-strand DNA-binding protein|uniref:Single-stranded DNA-binding protein n=3 Tax=Streptomyces thermoviolaceus TaxID=1952 RepID=A0ABX0Z092_STRTL|nr:MULTISPECIES: single-stranded DNA-binding protein [Streptomyces]MCM3266124.1 single-stranded DNA-binding protein [Streptomyces thermoviolaceus]NJP16703.1 single-stranded DNA-binding protein [Streptomyces thermoviolaceus subsp. thermoviolaceus]RSS01306.1 single-stranded DNA-binding protein [Streptomyces sp. WAC00469]WTD49191.1 single-stranded DNA-binding protein [Streptomyces thermoviolaceus]GGV80352.1 single-stranded DNA-binding protein 1 [Streptomyces thermoviolaceus subsp. apingens]
MNETMVCVVGNVATQVVYREPSSGPSARFRLAATSRYWDREKNAWTDGHTNFFTVWANRQLAMNVAASLTVGDPVLVQGRLKVRTEVRDGTPRTWADIDAVAIGHDLTRGTAAFRRTGRPEPVTTLPHSPAAPPDSRSTSAGQPAAAAPAPPEPTWETPLPPEAAQEQHRPDCAPLAVT